jgi:hypothetical protein
VAVEKAIFGAGRYREELVGEYCVMLEEVPNVRVGKYVC